MEYITNINAYFLSYSECTNGTYGSQCVKLCGQCRNGEDCDPVSGRCSLGCEPGWQGLRCQQSEHSLILIYIHLYLQKYSNNLLFT